MKKSLLLCIMDGFGLAETSSSNAISLAKTPNINYLSQEYPHTILNASGESVGLPAGQMGNSEVGHLNIGAGRVVYQALTLINKKIKDREFYQNKYFLDAINHTKRNNSNLHIFGLLSDGGVHSNINHIIALIKLAALEKVKKLYLHLFLDGRDVAPQSSSQFFKLIEEAIAKYQIGEIATISGRYYAMDRDKNFDRVEKAYLNITEFKGNQFNSPYQYIKEQYQILKNRNVEESDEFVEPGYNINSTGRLVDNDAVIFANFRPDRAIEISTFITNPTYYPNISIKPLKNIKFISMMKYADYVKSEIAYEIPELNNTLGEVLANRGYQQLRIAETEKYAHVTFFFDGGVNYDGVTKPELKNCNRILVNSPKVATYDLQPKMSIEEVTDKTVKAIEEGIYDVIILNLANCDMVGHTAIKEAVIKAVEATDEAVGKLYQAIKQNGGVMIVTADHGNAEKISDEKGLPFTAHTTNQVPFIITNKKLQLVNGGKLADIAPTILSILGEKIPIEMINGEGKILIK